MMTCIAPEAPDEIFAVTYLSAAGTRRTRVLGTTSVVSGARCARRCGGRSDSGPGPAYWLKSSGVRSVVGCVAFDQRTRPQSTGPVLCDGGGSFYRRSAGVVIRPRA